MTVDEELNLLEESVRRLKIEYDVFFGGGSKKPPTDTEWRVQSLLKKYSDSRRMSFAQRFRYNSIAQRYALFSDLWRQKVKVKEEGYRRPQDAYLGIQGVRTAPEEEKRAISVQCSNVDQEQDRVQQLYQAMVEARRQAGEGAGQSASLESFKNFLKSKTEQIRKDYGCHAVEYTVETEGGQVRLKAKAKV